ncbi:hypothetical protein [Spirosoma koreense]
MPQNPKSALIDFYEVNGSDEPITLRVTVSYKQNAVTSVRINERPVLPPDGQGAGESFVRSFATELGTNQDLIDKELVMKTFVHDINDEDNRTGLIIHLSGGVKERTWELGPITVEDGAIMLYSSDIGFFQRINS